MMNKSMISTAIISVLFTVTASPSLAAPSEQEIINQYNLEQQLKMELTSEVWVSDKEFLKDVPNLADKPFDLVILNGRVIDPASRLDAVRNIGIVGDRFAIITEEEIKGATTVDAEGLVVAPGFIDTHTHAMDELSNRIRIQDGVTTSGDTENGGLEVAKFYERRDNNSYLNYFTSVSHEFARQKVMDKIDVDNWESTFVYPIRAKAFADGKNEWSDRFPTEDELAQIKELMRKGLDEGAVSIATLIGYFPNGAEAKELYDLQKLAWQEYQRPFSGHFRMPPFGSGPLEWTIGIREGMANALSLGQPLLISHNNSKGWPEINEMINQANAQGSIVWAEQYPYAGGGPSIGAPPLSLENLKSWGQTPEKNIYDPEFGRYLTTEEFVELRETQPDRNVVWFARPEAWEAQLCAVANQTIASDMLPMLKDGKPLPVDLALDKFEGHPRSAGTYSKCLGIARENNIPLSLVINNSSTRSAKMMCKSGISDFCERGRLEAGMKADITMFDAKTVKDNSTFSQGENGLQPTGIPHVVVNGKLVLKDGIFNYDVKAGQPLRAAVK